MSLNWNIGRCRSHEDLMVDRGNGQYGPGPVTEAILFGTMAVGMNSITYQNWHLFYIRIAAWEKLYGPFVVMPGGEGRPITMADVHRHVGLVTNASSMTTAQFRKNMLDNFDREMKSQTERFTELREPADV